MPDYEKLPKKQLSLSDYFPKNSAYFYAYPSGHSSGFFSTTTPDVEELIAARPLCVAGPDVKVVVYPSTVKPEILKLLKEDLGLEMVPEENMIVLPESITESVTGEERNDMIKKALKELIEPGMFVMAQPFSDESMADLYQIPPDRTMWVNDKDNMPLYIPVHYLPTRQAAFADGQLFFESTQEFTFPCTVKITASASGDGVKICRDEKQLQTIKEEWKNIDQQILVESFVEAEKNVGVQFGIPADKDKEIEIIGWNEQVVTEDGDWLGGTTDYTKDTVQIEGLSKVLKEEVLPQIRDRGWYGVGGIDVLVGKDDRWYFIDCNFRVTGMTTFLFETLKYPKQPNVSFFGKFKGRMEEFKEKIVPLAKEKSEQQILKVIALREGDNNFQFNAAMFFNNPEDRKEHAQKLLDAGVEADVLKQIIEET